MMFGEQKPGNKRRPQRVGGLIQKRGYGDLDVGLVWLLLFVLSGFCCLLKLISLFYLLLSIGLNCSASSVLSISRTSHCAAFLLSVRINFNAYSSSFKSQQ